jgi:hypothetical protein
MDQDKSKRLAIILFALAAGVGVLGAIVFDQAPFGVGLVAFYAAVLVAGGIALVIGARVPRSVRWLALAGLPFAVSFAWRDANGVRVLNGLYLMWLIGLVAVRARGGAVIQTSIPEVLIAAPVRWLGFLTDGLLLPVRDVDWNSTVKGANRERLLRILVGLGLAVPLTLGFAGLLSSADPVFNRLLFGGWHLDFTNLFLHALLWGAVTWLACGLFRFALSPAKPLFLDALPRSRDPFKLGATEVGIVLTALNALFAAFVAVQFRYFFGGTDLVVKTAHLGYGDYARQGFFQLLSVVALALPILVGAKSLLAKSARNNAMFKVLSSAMIVLLLVVATSAAERMSLDIHAYELSPERVYALAGLSWILLSLLWFGVTTTWEKPKIFASGSAALLGLTIFTLTAISPDAVVARYNLDHASPGKLDVNMLASLSLDAAPVIERSFDRLPPQDRQVIASHLQPRLDAQFDWATWNLGLDRARLAYSGQLSELKDLAAKAGATEPAQAEQDSGE